jgi:hypothetical protein
MKKEEKKDLVLHIIEKGMGFLQTAMYAVLNEEDTELSPLPAGAMNERPAVVANGAVADGIYVVYEDGYYELFTSENDKEGHGGIKYIGVSYDGHAWCVSLENLGEWPLVTDAEKCPEESSFYCTECEGLIDWEFMERTKHIQEIGTDIPLEDGEYLPSLPMLVVMCAKKKIINEAIEYAGGEPMPDDYHWSCTEYYSTYARLVYFIGGIATYGSKYGSLAVRAVAAFPLRA